MDKQTPLSSTDDHSKKKVPKHPETGCSSVTKSSSHTQFFRVPRHSDKFKRITTKEYLNISESISSTDTFNCFHKDGKKYSPEGLLKRNFVKELDPITIDPTWTEGCPVTEGWGIVKRILFIVTDESALKQINRLKDHLNDLARISDNGYRVDVLKKITVIIDFLLDKMGDVPELRKLLIMIMKNMKKPILLSLNSDVVTYFDCIEHYMGFIVYLLVRLEDDVLFDLASDAILWQLKVPDNVRGGNGLRRCHALAAGKIVIEPVVNMLTSISSHRFGTFLEIAMLLAFDTGDNCIEMMKFNIIENIFYRFNPYFPDRKLPAYEINPADAQDLNVKLGDSSVHLPNTMSLLLVLLKTTIDFLDKKPQYRAILPCPDNYSCKCFIWTFRYECLARDHKHERITLTVIAAALLKCFQQKLMSFSAVFMPDVMSLSIMTEVPKRSDWIGKVNFNTLKTDVPFKIALIYLVVDMLKIFPCNRFMVQDRYWLLGVMYMLDPALGRLRPHLSSTHYDELRRIGLQALVVTIPLCDTNLIREYAMIRRILWYIEWYTESPYNIADLYWTVRLLQTIVCYKDTDVSQKSVADLYDTHGIVILTRLCYTLLEQKTPPIEKSQAVLSVCLQMLTNAIQIDCRRQVICCVYPTIRWPQTVFPLARRMMNIVLISLEKHYQVSDRWLVALLDFIWEAVIWHDRYREWFTAGDGVYNLLDLISMARPSVQCMAMALICDIIRAGKAVGQLVTWRARNRASSTCPMLVKRGSTIATLLAAIFRDECKGIVNFAEYDVLKDVDTFPLMRKPTGRKRGDIIALKDIASPMCKSAFNMAGSRRSKAFAILHMLSEDLKFKVDVADESYNLYKNIQLELNDETILVLCSHYLTILLNEAWVEVEQERQGLIDEDQALLNDFLQIGLGWNKEIKIQQEDVVAKSHKKDLVKENSLYTFLGRIRLNIALDALKSVRCVARSADRHRITHDLLHDAVFVHHRLTELAQKHDVPVLRTYKPPLDDINVIGQNIKVCSINPKGPPRLAEYLASPSSSCNCE